MGARGRKKILLFSGLIYLALLLYAYRNGSIVFAGDSSDYLRGALKPLFSLAFLSYRPFTITLIYKMMAANPLPIVLLQVSFYAGCWIFLAVAVKQWIRNRTIAWISFSAVLLFSLSIELNLWNLAVLSESLSLSMTALLLAVVLIWLQKVADTDGTRGRINRWTAAVLVCAFFWSFCRDSHPFALLMCVVLLVLCISFRPVRRRLGMKRAGLIGLVLVSIFLLQSWLLNQSGRTPWTYAVTTDICNRILPDRDARKFFYDHGMPRSKILLQFAGMHNEYEENRFSAHPDRSKIDPVFDKWVLNHGLKTYTRYVLTHPFHAFSWVWRARRQWIDPRVRGLHYGTAPETLVYHKVDGRHRLALPLCSRGLVNGDVLITHEISTLLFPMGVWVFPAAFLLALLVAAYRRRREAVDFVPLAIFLVGLVLVFVVVIGDANEIDRHAISASMLFRLALILSILFLGDGLLERIPQSGLMGGRFFASMRTKARETESRLLQNEILTRPLLVVSAVYVLLNIVAFRNSSLSFFGDALDYIQISRDPLFALHFFAYRPFTVPLLYKIFGSNPLAIVLFQVSFHAACWLVLACAVKRLMTDRRAAWGAFIGILLLSLSIQINMWGFAILAESVTNSLTVLLIGIALLYFRDFASGKETPAGPGLWLKTAGLILLAGFWSFARDTNPYVLLLAAGFIILIRISPRLKKPLPWKIGATIALTFVAIYVLQSWLLSHSSRKPWAYATTSNICYRILPHPQARAFFYEHGMPRSPILDRFAGKKTAYMENEDSAHPDKAKMDPKFDQWVARRGLQTYLAYIMTHPATALSWVWRDRKRIVSPVVLSTGYFGPFLIVYQVENKRRKLILPLCSRGLNNGSTLWTYWISDLFFLQGQWFLWMTLCAVLLCLALYLRGASAIWLLPVALFAVSIFQAIIINLGDCSDVSRHSITVAILLRLSFWIAAFLFADSICAHGSLWVKRLEREE